MVIWHTADARCASCFSISYKGLHPLQEWVINLHMPCHMKSCIVEAGSTISYTSQRLSCQYCK